jgi:hypothetical protein
LQQISLSSKRFSFTVEVDVSSLRFAEDTSFFSLFISRRLLRFCLSSCSSSESWVQPQTFFGEFTPFSAAFIELRIGEYITATGASSPSVILKKFHFFFASGADNLKDIAWPPEGRVLTWTHHYRHFIPPFLPPFISSSITPVYIPVVAFKTLSLT